MDDDSLLKRLNAEDPNLPKVPVESSRWQSPLTRCHDLVSFYIIWRYVQKVMDLRLIEAWNLHNTWNVFSIVVTQT